MKISQVVSVTAENQIKNPSAVGKNPTGSGSNQRDPPSASTNSSCSIEANGTMTICPSQGTALSHWLVSDGTGGDKVGERENTSMEEGLYKAADSIFFE